VYWLHDQLFFIVLLIMKFNLFVYYEILFALKSKRLGSKQFLSEVETNAVF